MAQSHARAVAPILARIVELLQLLHFGNPPIHPPRVDLEHRGRSLRAEHSAEHLQVLAGRVRLGHVRADHAAERGRLRLWADVVRDDALVEQRFDVAAERVTLFFGVEGEIDGPLQQPRPLDDELPPRALLALRCHAPLSLAALRPPLTGRISGG